MNDRGSWLMISTDQTGLRAARKKAKPRANEALSDAILRLATAGQGLDAIVRRLVQQGLRPNADNADHQVRRGATETRYCLQFDPS